MNTRLFDTKTKEHLGMSTEENGRRIQFNIRARRNKDLNGDRSIQILKETKHKTTTTANKRKKKEKQKMMRPTKTNARKRSIS